MSRLAQTVRGFKGRTAMVIGDVILDVFERGRAMKLAPDSPAPVVSGVTATTTPGGGANVAANMAAMGGRVSLISVVGDDETGTALLQKLERLGVDTGAVLRTPSRRTVSKRRVIADGVTLARIDSGDIAPVSADLEQELLRRAGEYLSQADVVVISDYLGGVMTQTLVDAICDHPLVVADSKDPARLRYRNLAAVTPNHLEAQSCVGVRVEPDPRGVDVFDLGSRLLERVGARAAAITLAEAGAAVVSDAGITRVDGRPVANPNVNGAGDTFVAAFALAIASGAEYGDAARIGVEAASLAVAQPGTVTVEYRDLLQRLGGEPEKELDITLEWARASGKTVVFTNGSFDLLHRGHLAMLERARQLGDMLVVGVNSDSSVERIKGVGRPVIPQRDRVELLKGLACVDHVVVFDEDTPEQVIRRIKPDIHVKGGDYEEDELIEAQVVREFGGEVVILPLLPGRSASSMIEKIKDIGASS